MRRELLKTLPALSMHFGLHPWDIDRLTYRELDTYLTTAAAIGAAQRQAAQRQRR
jgi:hypothetical protein